MVLPHEKGTAKNDINCSMWHCQSLLSTIHYYIDIRTPHISKQYITPFNKVTTAKQKIAHFSIFSTIHRFLFPTISTKKF